MTCLEKFNSEKHPDIKTDQFGTPWACPNAFYSNAKQLCSLAEGILRCTACWDQEFHEEEDV